MYGSAGKVAGRISAWAVPERNFFCSICSCSFKSRIPRANFNPYVKQSKWCWRDGVEYRVCRYHNGGEAACSQAALHGFCFRCILRLGILAS